MQLENKILEHYNPSWETFFELESESISKLLNISINKIHHFGSTAIPGSIAKPTIDIAIEIVNLSDSFDYFELLISSGYREIIHILPDRVCLTKVAEIRFHTYFVESRSGTFENWMRFKHILLKSTELLKIYNELKINIVRKRFKPNFDYQKYNADKTNFILNTLKMN